MTQKWLKTSERRELERCMKIYGYPSVRYSECEKEIQRREAAELNDPNSERSKNNRKMLEEKLRKDAPHLLPYLK